MLNEFCEVEAENLQEDEFGSVTAISLEIFSFEPFALVGMVY